MVNEKVTNVLVKMTTDSNKNIKILTEEFGDLNYVDSKSGNLLHILLLNGEDEVKTMLAIKALINSKKIDVNSKNNLGDNFIQTALLNGYSEKFILELITTVIANHELNFDINAKNYDGNSIMHTAIISNKYTESICSIYFLLTDNGFNSDTKNKRNEDILKTMMLVYEKEGKYTYEQLEQFKKIFNSKKAFKKRIIDEEDINKYGKILNNKYFDSNPTVNTDEEIENLIIGLASDKVSPLLIGERGVGKTVLIDELVYRIINNNVPYFLKDKIIIEVNPSEFVAGTKYAGTFEEKIKNLMDICKNTNAILFIDNIHRTCGTGTHDKSSVDMASMLSSYIERDGIKIIGTTTKEEYNEYLSNNKFKENFYVINVSEPDYNTLSKIIEKTILDYSMKTNINVNDILYNSNVIDLLIELTSKKHRMYNDNINNPKLVISIIDIAFAYAKSKNDNALTKDHMIKSIEMCNRIYPTTKQKIIGKLSNEQKKENKNNCKILKIDFTNKNK